MGSSGAPRTHLLRDGAGWQKVSGLVQQAGPRAGLLGRASGLKQGEQETLLRVLDRGVPPSQTHFSVSVVLPGLPLTARMVVRGGT